MRPILLVAPITSAGGENVLFAGHDLYDHYGVLLLSGQEPIILPAMNVDPTKTSSEPRLAMGAYSLVKARHKWKTPKETVGFFVMQELDAKELTQTWQVLYNSKKRTELPGILNGQPAKCTYINVHRGGVGPWASDWSQGCITLPEEYINKLYNSWPDGVHGYMYYAASLQKAADMAVQKGDR